MAHAAPELRPAAAEGDQRVASATAYALLVSWASPEPVRRRSTSGTIVARARVTVTSADSRSVPGAPSQATRGLAATTPSGVATKVIDAQLRLTEARWSALTSFCRIVVTAAR